MDIELYNSDTNLCMVLKKRNVVRSQEAVPCTLYSVFGKVLISLVLTTSQPEMLVWASRDAFPFLPEIMIFLAHHIIIVMSSLTVKLVIIVCSRMPGVIIMSRNHCVHSIVIGLLAGMYFTSRQATGIHCTILTRTIQPCCNSLSLLFLYYIVMFIG